MLTCSGRRETGSHRDRFRRLRSRHSAGRTRNLQRRIEFVPRSPRRFCLLRSLLALGRREPGSEAQGTSQLDRHGHGWATALIPCVRGARKHPDAWAGFSETQACRGSDTALVRIRNVWTKCTLVSARAKTILQGSVGKIVYYAPSLSTIFNM